MKKFLLTMAMAFIAIMAVKAQGVTTSGISGTVKDPKGETLPGANIVAKHEPSGTTYGATTLADGRFTIPSMRIGGPYTIKVSFVGFQDYESKDIFLSLGTMATLTITLSESATELEGVTVTGIRNDVFSSDRTGAATNISGDRIRTMPTLSRSINDFTRLTPQASGRSFLGADARNNNITVDGSILNSSFGLADQPGGRTGSTPISLDAIEEIQVNIAPYDVRQGGFIGAGVNAVTRSGTNDYTGSVFYNIRNKGFLGSKAEGVSIVKPDFKVMQSGFRIGGPIIKDKLFFFANAEIERRSEPMTTFRANNGAEPVAGNVTRVLASDLDALSTYLQQNFNYATGPYQGYQDKTISNKYLVKLDYNINQNHKASLRYNYLDSQDDVLTSNSSSLGFGSRRTNLNALNYQNSNYIQYEKIHSVIGEVNSRFGNKLSNNLILGYTYQNEDRGSHGQMFPLVEIQNAGSTYITFGYEPFTPSNKLEYKTFQFQDNVTYYAGKHIVTAGLNMEKFNFRNVFFPGSQSVYVYNSLTDFYTDADAYLLNQPATSPVNLRRFQLRYSALPGGAEPVQPSEVFYAGIYLQDEFEPIQGLKITGGIRADMPKFKNTGYENTTVAGLSFLDKNSNSYSINTATLPSSHILVSPRLGVNYDILGDRKLQVRGGTGLFTGRPVFVWISNQIGNNGVLTGFDQINGTNTRPFRPDPAAYIPANATLPTSVEIAATDPGFKFPQIWRSNIAVDQKLPWAGLIGTVEYIYSQDVNGITYFNANLPGAQIASTGPDSRPLWTQNRLNTPPNPPNYTITSAEVMTNTKLGYSYSLSFKIEKPLTKGFYGIAAYNLGKARNTIDPGSIARGSWAGNPIVFDPNNPGLAYSNNDQKHRAFVSLGYRKEYGEWGSTQVSLFWEGRTQGRYSYIYSGDANGDGGVNDLIYVAKDVADMNFVDYNIQYRDVNNVNQTVAYTATQQAADWDAFISQDKYLNSIRGDFAHRNGALMPWLFRADFSLIQEFYIKLGEKKNTLQLRFDVFNITNLINNKWGVGDETVVRQPLNWRGTDVNGRAFHRMNYLSVSNTGVISPYTKTYTTGASVNDVWQAQFGVRYIFN